MEPRDSAPGDAQVGVPAPGCTTWPDMLGTGCASAVGFAAASARSINVARRVGGRRAVRGESTPRSAGAPCWLTEPDGPGPSSKSSGRPATKARAGGAVRPGGSEVLEKLGGL